MPMSVRALQEVGERPTGQGPRIVHAEDARRMPQDASCTDGGVDEHTFVLVCSLSMEQTGRKKGDLIVSLKRVLPVQGGSDQASISSYLPPCHFNSSITSGT